jgi:hypothetical protein
MPMYAGVERHYVVNENLETHIPNQYAILSL